MATYQRLLVATQEHNTRAKTWEHLHMYKWKVGNSCSSTCPLQLRLRQFWESNCQSEISRWSICRALWQDNYQLALIHLLMGASQHARSLS